MGNLCDNFGRIARKNARVRDCTDTLVLALNEYASREKTNSSSRKGLVNFGGYLCAVEDYRSAMIDRVERRVILPASKYQEYLKSSRKTIKATMAARDKERREQQKVSHLMQRQPGNGGDDNGRNIAKAEALAENAASRVTTQDKILAEELDTLEKKKLNDMRVRLQLLSI
jgi:hypothetical protein